MHTGITVAGRDLVKVPSHPGRVLFFQRARIAATYPQRTRQIRRAPTAADFRPKCNGEHVQSVSASTRHPSPIRRCRCRHRPTPARPRLRVWLLRLATPATPSVATISTVVQWAFRSARTDVDSPASPAPHPHRRLLHRRLPHLFARWCRRRRRKRQYGVRSRLQPQRPLWQLLLCRKAQSRLQPWLQSWLRLRPPGRPPRQGGSRKATPADDPQSHHAGTRTTSGASRATKGWADGYWCLCFCSRCRYPTSTGALLTTRRTIARTSRRRCKVAGNFPS